MTQNLDHLAEHVKETLKDPHHPPLEKWNPELTGEMDLIVTRDGQWLYKAKPLAREAIVRLFSTIMRREKDGEYYLVTPVEKWRVQVEDTPLLAHSLTAEGEGDTQVLKLTTNVGEVLEVGAEHPIEVGIYPNSENPRPVIHVRHGLVARLVTPAYYDLVDNSIERTLSGERVFGVFSRGDFYIIG